LARTSHPRGQDITQQEDNKIAYGIINGRMNMDKYTKKLMECGFEGGVHQLGIKILKEDWEPHKIFMTL
jgi:hypothetical protein